MELNLFGFCFCDVAWRCEQGRPQRKRRADALAVVGSRGGAQNLKRTAVHLGEEKPEVIHQPNPSVERTAKWRLGCFVIQA